MNRENHQDSPAGGDVGQAVRATRTLHRAGVWGAIVLLGVASATALSTGESGTALSVLTATSAMTVLALGWATRSDRRATSVLATPVLLMGYRGGGARLSRTVWSAARDLTCSTAGRFGGPLGHQCSRPAGRDASAGPLA